MMNSLVHLLMVMVMGDKVTSLPDIIKIGGLFDVTDQERGEGKQETAFRYAVERINHDREILNNTVLSAQIEKIPPDDSFHASKRVCHLLRSGVAALFGPESGTTSSHIQSICDALEIPHIETRWDYIIKRDSYSINLHPSPKLISKAYMGLIKSFGWQTFTILYQDNQSLVRLQELLKSPTDSDIKILVRQLNFKDNDDNKNILREVKQSGEIHIVLDCDQDNIRTVMKDAQAVGMMTAYHNYLITNLDLHLVDLEDFKYGGTNITAFRLVDPFKAEVQEVVKTWMLGEKRFPSRSQNSENLLIKTETALMYDAVHLFAKALNELDQSQVITTQPLSCSGEDTWQHGNSLVNYMKLVEMEGLTGKVKFDQKGLRTDFELEIVELKKHGLEKVGTWHDQYGIKFSRNFTETYSEIVESLQNKTLVVTTIMSPPYSMFKESAEKLVGNDAFEGYAIDLVAEIAKILKFNYTFKWVDDGAYGYKNKETGEWNGLMGELLSQPPKAQLAIADLTITTARNEDIDFTMPFMKLGISILFEAPEKVPPTLFAFLNPFSTDIWASIGAAFLMVSIILFVVARFTPMEWVLLDPCDQANEPDEVEQSLKVNHCFWWAWAAVMWMGCEVAPTAMSTRFVAGMWYLFTLIMVSSYIANLSASLTAENLETPLESADDLANQNTIQYGCLKGGSTCNFFRESSMGSYYQMWNFMSANPDVFMESNKEGIERVKESNGGYAYLMESTSIEYIVERECGLAKVGGELDSKSYGIGLRKNSPYSKQLNQALLQLQENGAEHKLKTKWWKEKGAKNCQALRNTPNGARPLGLANVSGAFLVLILGMALATITGVMEFLWTSKKILRNQNSDKCSHLKKEALSSFGRRGHKYNLKKNTSPMSVSQLSMNDNIVQSAIETHGLSVPLPSRSRPVMPKKSSLNIYPEYRSTRGNKKTTLMVEGEDSTSSTGIEEQSSASSSSELK